MKLATENQAKEKVRYLVNEVKSNLNIANSPSYQGVDHIITNYLGIQVQEGKHPLGDGDGYYVPNPKPTILIDPKVGSRERLNFSFYHEITHHLIKQDDDLYDFINEYAFNKFEKTLEYYCNLGAAEFLVPLNEVRRHIRHYGFSINLIRVLDVVYLASKPAIAIQLSQATNHKCIIVVCEYGVIPNKSKLMIAADCQEEQPQLFVHYASSSPSCKYSISQFIAIPRTHLIYSAYLDKQDTKGRDKTIFRSGKNWIVDCEAIYYKGKVFATFNISTPIPRNQMMLDI